MTMPNSTDKGIYPFHSEANFYQKLEKDKHNFSRAAACSPVDGRKPWLQPHKHAGSFILITRRTMLSYRADVRNVV